MTVDEQKDLFKATIKTLLPIMHTQLGDALDFAVKFVELGHAFNKLQPVVQQSIMSAFIKIAFTSYPLQFNKNYKRF